MLERDSEFRPARDTTTEREGKRETGTGCNEGVSA